VIAGIIQSPILPRMGLFYLLSLLRRVNQFHPGRSVRPLVQWGSVCREKDLNRRISMEREDVAPNRRAIGSTQNRMHVNRRTAIQNSNVASQSENLHLEPDRDCLVHLAIKVEPRQRSTPGCADSGYRSYLSRLDERVYAGEEVVGKERLKAEEDVEICVFGFGLL